MVLGSNKASVLSDPKDPLFEVRKGHFFRGVHNIPYIIFEWHSILSYAYKYKILLQLDDSKDNEAGGSEKVH